MSAFFLLEVITRPVVVVVASWVIKDLKKIETEQIGRHWWNYKRNATALAESSDRQGPRAGKYQLAPDGSTIGLVKERNYPGCEEGQAGRDVIESYRPIALTSCLGKLAERLIKNRLYYLLERTNQLHPNQSAFRSGRSTQDQTMRLIQEVSDAFESREKRTAAVSLTSAERLTRCGTMACTRRWWIWNYRPAWSDGARPFSATDRRGCGSTVHQDAFVASVTDFRKAQFSPHYCSTSSSTASRRLSTCGKGRTVRRRSHAVDTWL